MKVSPKPINEKERLEEILSYHILDSQAEQEYDDIVELAAQLCNVPIVVITLLDQNRQWFKAKKGLDMDEIPIDLSFCAHAIHGATFMVVEDALKDERFFDNPLVTGPPHIRFYAGLALTSPRGFRLGTLAVIDQKPRTLSPEQFHGLDILVKQTMNLLNLRIRNWTLSRDIAEKTHEVSDILGRISEAFIAVDQHWQITFINQKAAAITQRRIDDVLGKNLWMEFPEAFSSEFPSLAKAAMLTQEPQYYENYFHPYQMWLEAHLYPSHTGLSIYFRNITERKTTEEAIKVAEEKFRSIFENASEGIYQTTPAGKFITANPAMAKMLGYESPEHLISSITDIASQLYADGDKRGEVKRRLAKSGAVDGIELRLVKKDKTLIWVNATIRSVLQEDGPVKYYEGAIKDITERKASELKLHLQFEELKKTNQELDRFVYSASHDLRAPLATILGLLNIADLESNQPAIKGYHLMIRNSVNKLDGFIRDILDYSLNARKDLQIEKIDFDLLISDTLNQYNFLTTPDHFKIRRSIDTTYPFYSDRHRVAIIFNNLISNAFKYQDVNKEESFINIDVRTWHDCVIVRFTDNGIGIAVEHLDKIFNMFYRASEVAKGSGLGLYIAKETATKLGGDIKVNSAVKKGTTFELSLPNLMNQDTKDG